MDKDVVVDLRVLNIGNHHIVCITGINDSIISEYEVFISTTTITTIYSSLNNVVFNGAILHRIVNANIALYKIITNGYVAIAIITIKIYAGILSIRKPATLNNVVVRRDNELVGEYTAIDVGVFCA